MHVRILETCTKSEDTADCRLGYDVSDVMQNWTKFLVRICFLWIYFPWYWMWKWNSRWLYFIRLCNKNMQKHFGERMVPRKVWGLESHLVNECNFINTIKIFNPIISHCPFQNVIFFCWHYRAVNALYYSWKGKAALVSKANLGKCHGLGWEDAYDNYRSSKGCILEGGSLLHAAPYPMSFKVTLLRFHLKWIWLFWGLFLIHLVDQRLPTVLFDPNWWWWLQSYSFTTVLGKSEKCWAEGLGESTPDIREQVWYWCFD